MGLKMVVVEKAIAFDAYSGAELATRVTTGGMGKLLS